MARFTDENGFSLIEHDPKLGRTVWAKTEPDGRTTYRTDYQVDPTIDTNTAQRNMARGDWQGDYHHVASIPPGIFWDKLGEAARNGDDKYISRFLNDSDNRAWRTKEGNL